MFQIFYNECVLLGVTHIKCCYKLNVIQNKPRICSRRTNTSRGRAALRWEWRGSRPAIDQAWDRRERCPHPPTPTPPAARLITEASQLTVRVTSEHVTLHIVKSQRNGPWRLVWGDSRLPAADPGLPIKTHKSVLNPTTGNSFKKKTKIRIKRVSREKTLRVLDDFLAKERREVCRWPASPRASSVRLRRPWHVVNTSH